MKVVLYARISKALDQNPENQLIDLRNWAKNSGHTIIGEFVDEISSKDTRPQKELVLKKLRLGEIDGVAFWSLDRWGRTMTELVLELDEFAKTGQSLISLKEGIDLSTAAGRLSAHLFAAMANFERDRIRERTILGLQRARAQGKKLGRPSKDGKKYKKPSKEKVLDLFKQKYSIREMAKELDTSKYWIEYSIKELKKENSLIEITN